MKIAKKLFLPVLAVIMAFSLSACKNEPLGSNEGTVAENAQTDNHEENESKLLSDAENEATKNDKRMLVAYFSATGTTKHIAELVASVVDADLFEIVPEQPYTSDDLNYNSQNSRANNEMSDPSCRPSIATKVDNIDEYDVVFVGYPIWWGEAPRIMSSFVEEYDLSGKTIVTFCTSGSSAINDKSLRELAEGANWITGRRFDGSASQSKISDWINGLGFDSIS